MGWSFLLQEGVFYKHFRIVRVVVVVIRGLFALCFLFYTWDILSLFTVIVLIFSYQYNFGFLSKKKKKKKKKKKSNRCLFINNSILRDIIRKTPVIQSSFLFPGLRLTLIKEISIINFKIESAIFRWFKGLLL